MNKEKIRKFNQENNGKFIISGSELIIPTHQLPPESLQLSACWKRGERGRTNNSWESYPHNNYYKDYNNIEHNCKSCSLIHNYLGLNYKQEHEPRVDEGRWTFFFKVTERMVPSPNQYEFNNSLKQEIKRYYDVKRLEVELSTGKKNQWLYVDGDVNKNPDPDAEPKTINFVYKHDDALRLWQNNLDGKREVKKELYIVLTEECWRYFLEDSDGSGIIYLQKDADFLVKWGEREIMDYINSNSVSPTPHTPSPTPTPTPPNPEPITEDERIYLIGAEIIEIAEKNREIVRRGRELGLNLRDISGAESGQFEVLINHDFPLEHPNNAEARRVERFVRDTYQENQRKLAEVERERQQPSPQENLQQVRNQAIATITQLMDTKSAITDSDLLEDNRNWRDLINNSDDPEKINELKERILADIHSKRKENSLFAKLVALLEKAEKEENYEKLKAIFVEVEKYNKYDFYNKLAGRIDALKEKLVQKNPTDYYDTNVQNVENEMKKRGLSKNDLDDEGQAALDNLKNGTNNPGAVNNLTKTVINSVNKKDAENKLDKLLEEYKNAPNETSKKSVKKKIFNFINNRENAYQKVYQNRKSEVNKILGINSSWETNKDNFPVVPVIFGSLIVFLIILAVILVQKQSSKRRK